MAILGIQTFTDENFLTLNNYETVSQEVTVLDNEATIWRHVFVAHLLTARIRLNMNRIDYGA